MPLQIKRKSHQISLQAFASLQLQTRAQSRHLQCFQGSAITFKVNLCFFIFLIVKIYDFNFLYHYKFHIGTNMAEYNPSSAETDKQSALFILQPLPFIQHILHLKFPTGASPALRINPFLLFLLSSTRRALLLITFRLGIIYNVLV